MMDTTQTTNAAPASSIEFIQQQANLFRQLSRRDQERIQENFSMWFDNLEHEEKKNLALYFAQTLFEGDSLHSHFMDISVITQARLPVYDSEECDLIHQIYNSEYNFQLWLKNVEKYYHLYCPNFATGRTRNGEIYISPEFFIQYSFAIVTFVFARDHHDMLALFKCGDVELNPGPPILTKHTRTPREIQEAKLQALTTLARIKRTQRRQQMRDAKQMFTQMFKNAREGFSNMRDGIYDFGNNISGTAKHSYNFSQKMSDILTNLPDLGDDIAQTATNTRNFTGKMNEMFNSMPELVKKHTNLADVATKTIELFNNTISNLNNLTQQTEGVFAQLLTFGKENFYKILGSFFCIIMAFTFPNKYVILPIIVFILYLLGWNSKVIDKIKELLFKLTGSFFMCQGFEDSIPLMGQIFFTMMAYMGVSQIPGTKFYDNLIKRMDSIPKAFSGAHKIWEASGKAFQCASDEFKFWFLGFSRKDLQREIGIGQEIKEWSDTVYKYLQMPERVLLQKDSEAVREVEELYTTMYRWKHTTAIWKSIPSEYQRVIVSLTPQMNELFHIVCKSTVHEGGPRKAPISVLFSGDSGRGKSELLIPLSYCLLKNRGFTKNLRNEIYVRNYETEYWDGYVGQKIVHFDDAFQIKDSANNPSTEFMEAIRINNTAPAHVHGADINDKGRFFSSEVCIYTTNLTHNFQGYIQSMNCPEAAVRRLNLNAFRVLTDPKYEHTISHHGALVKRLNPKTVGWSKARQESKCVCQRDQLTGHRISNPVCNAHPCQKCKLVCEREGLEQMAFCPHHYLFQRYNMHTDANIGEPLTFNQLLENLKNYDQNLCSREQSKLDFYERFAENVEMFTEGWEDEVEKEEQDLNPFDENGEYKAAQKDNKVVEDEDYDSENFHDARNLEDLLPPDSNCFAVDYPQRDEYALDLSVPEDYLKFWKMYEYKKYIMSTPAWKYGEELVADGLPFDFCNLILQEMSADAKLFQTYTYVCEHGVKNYGSGDASLVAMLIERSVEYNFEKQRYYCKRIIPSVKNILIQFGEFLTAKWNQFHEIMCKTPVMRQLELIKMAITGSVIALSMYNLFKVFQFNKQITQNSVEFEEWVKQKEIQSRLTNEALFGPCGMEKFLTTDVNNLNINVARVVGTAFCFFKCSNCDHMREYLAKNNIMFKMGFDDETVIYNSRNLLAAYQTVYMKNESNSSGEPNMHKTAPLKVEQLSTGDALLTKPAAIRTEVLSSGDALITRNAPIRTETASSGDASLHKMAPVKTENIFSLNRPTISDLQNEGLADFCGRQITYRLLMHSQYLLHTSSTPIGNVLFLKGTLLLFPYHYITILRHNKINDNTKLCLSNTSGKALCEIIAKDLMNYVRLEKNGEPCDAVIVNLNNIRNKVHLHPDISKNFIPQSHIKNMPGTCKYECEIPTMSPLSLKQDKISVVIHNAKDVNGFFDRTQPFTALDSEQQIIEYRDSWRYFARTDSGDCGAPLIIHDPSVSHKILGIHCAGSADGTAMATLITQEMIATACEKLDLTNQSVPIYENFSTIDEVYGMERIDSVPLKEGLVVLGKIPEEYHIMSPGRTKIIPSALLDVVTPHKTLPTKLRPTDGVDPMYNGLLKFGKIPPLINVNMINIAANDVFNRISFNYNDVDNSHMHRVLTIEEAIQGVPNEEFLAPLNRSTSLGFPWTIKYSFPSGKREAYGENEWTLDTPQALEIQEAVEKLIDDCKKGIQRDVYWTDTLKDERRPIEKVRAGKTRVFTAGPVHFTIAFRMYFLGFASWIMKNRNFNEISTGTNVYSQDWEIIARKLKSKAGLKKKTNIVAGDFENFDGSLSSQILWRILDLINDWYDDSEENKRIRRTLWCHIVHAMHVNGSILYSTTHSQPSGCPLTAILNSIYNSITIRIVYMICADTYEKEKGLVSGELNNMKKFNEFVACVSYGDDNLIAILESIISWFNQETITDAYLKIGHKYTDERKSGEIFVVRELSEVQFLKRKFLFDELVQRHIAPLDLDVVLEIFQWTKKGSMKNDILLANIDTSLRELSLHGETIFNFYAKILRRECMKRNIHYSFATYEEYKNAVLKSPLILEGKDKFTEDIFDTDKFIVHCVSGDMQMSRGFAAQLVQRKLDLNTLEFMRKRKHNIGFNFLDKRRKLIHMVTKENYYDKPRNLDNFIKTLINLNQLLIKNNIKEIAMPAIQCGLDAKYTHLTIPHLKLLLDQYLPGIDVEIFA